ncbi:MULTISPECIES: cytochrome P450 [unclassified Rossellomorea]|uniref:cytochrome P450 n=1 Tax=unclassified Rossellomorea TaxID=2837526 RepID=UPI0020C5DDA6|nr:MULTISPECIES: cytochrome P450 [unclassified Rossellomorea]UTE75719.1 cytochrome P450 [Rossellomorea sp. KS-H15a]WGG43547.1 cytochrome P450 [Rossellomorea sp. DA94]
MPVQVPKDKGIDRTLSIFMDGYEFIQKRTQKHHLDVYETKVLGKKVALLSGESGVKLFYDNEKMKRNGAMPPHILNTLFGKGGVQTLDGKSHEHRKRLFMSLMTPEGLDELHKLTTRQWDAYTRKWEKKNKVNLFKESLELLTKVGCEWAGIPIEEKAVPKRSKDLNRLIEGASKIGPQYLASLRARNRLEKWIESVIHMVRQGQQETRKGSALYEMAFHQDLNGDLLDKQVAAVELINVIRPLVAISRYLVFGAVALEENPEWKEKIHSHDEDLRCFVQEVRRYYPFFPFLAALTTKDFEWQQYHFKKGQMVMLDLYGTNHDPRIWENPDHFEPGRFKDYKGSIYELVPQGGGDYDTGHRCPGEWPTIEVMKASFSFMSKHLNYELPKQDMSYSLREIPTLPKSGFVMKKVYNK